MIVNSCWKRYIHILILQVIWIISSGPRGHPQGHGQGHVEGEATPHPGLPAQGGGDIGQGKRVT